MVKHSYYADFQSAKIAQRTETLPENLWKARDKEQFDYLDNLIGGCPEYLIERFFRSIGVLWT